MSAPGKSVSRGQLRLRHKLRWRAVRLLVQERRRLFGRAQDVMLLLLLALAMLLVLLLPLVLLLRLPLLVILQQAQQVWHTPAQDGVPHLRLSLGVCSTTAAQHPGWGLHGARRAGSMTWAWEASAPENDTTLHSKAHLGRWYRETPRGSRTCAAAPRLLHTGPQG